MMKSTNCIIVLLFLAMLSICDARICYNCTGDCVTDSECKGSCKTITHELGDEVEVRTCIEDVVEAECNSEEINGKPYKVCYCNTERCNSSSVLTATVSVLIVALLVSYNN